MDLNLPINHQHQKAAMNLTLPANENKNTDIDVTLAVICAIAKEGETMTFTDMAELCGCNPSYIQKLYAKAMKKLRKNNALLGYEG